MNRMYATLLAIGMIACQRPRELSHSEFTVEAVAESALEALADNDESALNELRVTEQEFRKILWPELPARKNNVPLRFAWENMNYSSIESLRNTLRKIGGGKFRLERVYFKEATESYASFKVHPGAMLVVKDRDGVLKEIRLFGSILERNGEFKIIGYVD